jgi:hypothetical protein
MSDETPPELDEYASEAPPGPASTEIEVVDPNKVSGLVTACLQKPEVLHPYLDTRSIVKLGAVIAGSMVVVGLVMATFSGGAQLLAVPLKVSLGTLIAMGLCLPSLFVFANLSGSRMDLRQAAGSMIVAVAVVALALLALAPVALVFSTSTDSVSLVGSIHIAVLLIGVWFGGRALKKVWTMKGSWGASAAGLWMLLFLVVLLQLSTAFRPLIGPYESIDLSDKKIFVEHWLDPDAEGRLSAEEADRVVTERW